MTTLLSAEIIAQRVFELSYIVLDSIFIAVFLAALVLRRRYMTALFAIGGGVLYMIVDYGIFHLALHTRSIEGGDLFWVLLWMSMSYGITNFALIWLWVRKDEYFVEYTAAIWIWWICCPIISSMCGGNVIKIQRTTGVYHGFMAVFMAISYFALIAYNLAQKDVAKRVRIAWLFVLGVLVQLGWEIGLLVGGVRSAEFEPLQKLATLVTNSLLETNLGLPALYCIFIMLTSRYDEALRRLKEPLSFTRRLAQNNAERYRKEKHSNV